MIPKHWLADFNVDTNGHQALGCLHLLFSRTQGKAVVELQVEALLASTDAASAYTQRMYMQWSWLRHGLQAHIHA